MIKSEKTPLTRLLDLTAGWAAFVQQEDEAWPDPAVSLEELCDLYQEAGALVADDLSAEEETRIVREFVETRLLNLLLRQPQSVWKTQHTVLA